MPPIDEPPPYTDFADDDTAEDLDAPIDLGDLRHDAEAVVFGARLIEAEAEAPAADDDETDEPLDFLEESDAMLREADGIVVDALRMQEDVETSIITEPPPAELDAPAETHALAPNAPSPADTLPAPSSDAPTENVADDTTATTKPTSKRRIDRSPATRQSSKRSTRNRN